ncbi:MAG: OadG family protein [Synergistaceae bacterium]|jgi:Na+-transporting methylmalonyl-CoA/oxaloacetate decarboxylase gamma subunit|nr:OadG family protein [Synergistaceae bacterium]
MVSSIASNFVGWQGGILMSVIAFSIVFLVIAGLMCMMMVLKHFVKVINPDKQAVGGTEGANSAPRPPVVTAAVRYEPPASGDGELVAVLAAAITAMSGHAAAVLNYAPVEAALRRPSASAWKMTGILSNSRGLRD